MPEGVGPATLVYDRAMEPAHGRPVEIKPGVRRVTAANPGAFTFHGTNAWVLGEKDGPFVVVDPGPESAAQCEALLRASHGRIGTILVTHTHRDHSPGVAALRRASGALVAGCGPHTPARPMADNAGFPLDAAADRDFRAERVLADGEVISTAAGPVRTIATPGHTANHLAFAFERYKVIAVGDHVMSWSTSIIAPPDGSMADYMASLDRLDREPITTYLPGHGNAVADGRALVAGLRQHRHDREAAILKALAGRTLGIEAIVRDVYRDIDPALHRAAGLSVLAQLHWLIARGLARAAGNGGLDDRFSA